MITKTIGGDRVGAGKKMQAHLHDYYRSTHNLSEKWASTMGVGILYPAMCKLATRGDSFDIEINADTRTIPTKGALFGSYKFQVDVYQCPIRLYQALLHNNPLAIGLNAGQIKFPMLHIKNYQRNLNIEDGAFSNTSLLKYLGMSGLGKWARPAGAVMQGATVEREINAIPALAYYDIFKNYYSNKQEEIGYVITTTQSETAAASSITSSYIQEATRIVPVGEGAEYIIPKYVRENNYPINITIEGSNLNDQIEITARDNAEEPTEQAFALGDLASAGAIKIYEQNGDTIKFQLYQDVLNALCTDIVEFDFTTYAFTITNASGTTLNKTQLVEFDLSNIDDMRYDILSSHTLGSAFVIGQDAGEKGKYLPYSTLTSWILPAPDATTGFSKNRYALNGLVVKTYQNDIYNNWLNTEWIEGENSISELSKVSVVDGSFSMDALNMAQKIYNMLNRVAISGGTYEDYQDVVWEEVKRRQIESPVYCGGMSQEIMFDEVIQTAPADGDPLGSLGGRGQFKENTKKGGKIHIKCDEACFIIAIVSITPRIFQTQGNEFYMTDVQSFDDLHKPAMDGIGFQDLIGERMAYFDTTLQTGTTTPKNRSKVGKLPAWIEYMTSVDRAYGDFAETGGRGYMILNRNYTMTPDGEIDFTTYVDPAKYNYVFAYTELDAQNFWVEIGFNIKARRLMSARLIPNV